MEIKMTILNICGRRSGEIELQDVKSQNKSDERKYDCTENVTNYVKEYCREGSLHGVKYLGEKRTIIEKIWWSISMIVALYLCITLILNTLKKWENSPVLVSFATTETPILLIPFPTVTICPETKSLPTKFNYTNYYNMLKENQSLDADTERKFGYLSPICNYKKDVNFNAFTENYAGIEFFDFLDEVSPKISDVMSECKFMGKFYNCKDIFFPVVTDEGVCFTFNLLDRSQLLRDNVARYKNYHKASSLSNWTLHNGYSIEDPLETYPKRAIFSGTADALEAKLTMFEEDLDYSCTSSVQGYTVQLSQPSQYPRVRKRHYRIPLNQIIVFAVTPEVTTTSDAIQSYDPLKRDCYFPDEKALKYFKVYSQQNCQMECRTNHTLEKCGCVNFYMPRTNGTKVCTGSKLNCLNGAQRELLLDWMTEKLKMINEGKKVKDRCDCPPVCTSMYYNVEISQDSFSWRQQYDTRNGTKNMSYFRIYFKNSQFITMDRNELYNVTDFLANFGGLLGLFVGFSMLSLIELIYYLTLRIICNIRLFGWKNWSGKTD